MPSVIVQNWTERERGFGRRPDGFTIHPDNAHREAYIAWYYKEFHTTAVAPDSYTLVDSPPLLVDTTAAIRARVVRVASSGTPDKVAAMWGIGSLFDSAALEDKHVPTPTRKKPAKAKRKATKVEKPMKRRTR